MFAKWTCSSNAMIHSELPWRCRSIHIAQKALRRDISSKRCKSRGHGIRMEYKHTGRWAIGSVFPIDLITELHTRHPKRLFERTWLGTEVSKTIQRNRALLRKVCSKTITRAFNRLYWHKFYHSLLILPGYIRHHILLSYSTFFKPVHHREELFKIKIIGKVKTLLYACVQKLMSIARKQNRFDNDIYECPVNKSRWHLYVD